MSNEETFRRYLLATNELLIEFAREAKRHADESRGTEASNFNSGYLMGFHRVISLMQQQAAAFGLDVADVGLSELDADRDLT